MFNCLSSPTGSIYDSASYQQVEAELRYNGPNALIYVERAPCLDEIGRLLRPGGEVLLGGLNSTGRLLQKLVFGLEGDSPHQKTNRKQAVEALRKGPYYDGKPNYMTLDSVAPILERHGLRVKRTGEQGNRVAGRFPVFLHVLAEKALP